MTDRSMPAGRQEIERNDDVVVDLSHYGHSEEVPGRVKETDPNDVHDFIVETQEHGSFYLTWQRVTKN